MSAQDEMVRGYLSGFNGADSDLPERYAKESAAFRHGWLNGRDDRMGKPHERCDVLRRRADLILGNA